MRNSDDDRPSMQDTLARALAEPTRRAILENLRLGKKTVTELVRATRRKQPNLSNHLARMREQGLVSAERRGRQVYYSLNTPYADVLLGLFETAALPAPEAGTLPRRGVTSDPASTTAVDDMLATWREQFLQ
ncbi:MAG: metalloregulator ArsR/SmtB family transcription factor, partial [Chloroherpetonaceae bacterium]|nr:metalloregulator ArsR/SmtB family transcription factor [Chthonomonadaceae bacterium]MDW8209048.1 metalloregulator ArsR/SmtB family transcription factor [Chloroherpetonaceae bacterium]